MVGTREEPLSHSHSRALTLQPSFCINTTALRDFLRFSRASTDDSISLHLNSLLKPSTQPFSTASSPSYSRPRGQVAGEICKHFKNTILFPIWYHREQVLAYCEQVALHLPTDNEDDRLDVAVHMPSDALMRKAPLQSVSRIPNESLASQQSPIVSSPLGKYAIDERTDPYSARDYSFNRQSKAVVLKNLLESERAVETIVRTRTWALIYERCVDERDVDSINDGNLKHSHQWDRELAEWKRNYVSSSRVD